MTAKSPDAHAYIDIDMSSKKTKRVDAVGIEPTTFHMCEDAKRLKMLLVECSDETGFER